MICIPAKLEVPQYLLESPDSLELHTEIHAHTSLRLSKIHGCLLEMIHGLDSEHYIDQPRDRLVVLKELEVEYPKRD
jgi:hypothetical protein